MEVSTERHAALKERWGAEEFVQCHHASSIPVDRLPSAVEVERFMRMFRPVFATSIYPPVLGWLQQDVDYLREHGLSSPGIAEIKERYGIETFDAVLIDGSEFAGPAEL
jgi:hypothetical protein